jgi:hypothetical protein
MNSHLETLSRTDGDPGDDAHRAPAEGATRAADSRLRTWAAQLNATPISRAGGLIGLALLALTDSPGSMSLRRAPRWTTRTR